MKRVLVIDEALPFPADSGKRIRTSELLTRLSSHFDITLAYHVEAPLAPEAIQEAKDAGLTLLPVPRRPLVKRGLRFAWDLGRNVMLPVPYMVMGHRTTVMRDAIETSLATHKPDLIHVEWTPLVANVPRTIDAPVCVSAHNIEADIWKRYHENERSIARRAYIGMQYRKVHRFEHRALGAADAVTAVSEHDGDRIASWTGQRHVTVVPNGVNARYFSREGNAARDANDMLFVGALDWRPNQDGLVWFLDEVYPKIRAARPATVFSIVGRNPPAWLAERARAEAGVMLHGSVPDVRPYMAMTSAFVVPLRIGGGSRLKICEALAMEAPVISTTIGAEGLALSDGLVRADDATSFATGVCHTLDEPDAAKDAHGARARARDAAIRVGRNRPTAARSVARRDGSTRVGRQPMKRVLATLVDALLCGLGAERVFRFRNRNKLLILMYHGVVEERLSPFCWHQIPVAAFREQLTWIRTRYHPMHLDDALDALAKGGAAATHGGDHL